MNYWPNYYHWACCRGPSYEWSGGVPEPLQGWNVSYVVVPPAVEPLSLDQVKLYHRIDNNVEDSEIERLIKSARQWVEEYLESSLVQQTREINLRWYSEGMRLPYGPVQEIVSTTDAAPYVVQYIAGYPAAGEDLLGNIPAPIIQAMQLLIGDMFENRENAVIGTLPPSTLPLAVEAHLEFYRYRRGFA